MATNEETMYEEQNNTPERTNRRNNILLILLSLLLLGSIGYNVYQYIDQAKKEKTFNEEIFSSNELKTQLNNQIKAANAQLDEYKGRNANLDAEIEKDRADIAKRAEQITKLLKSNKINYNKYLEVKDKLDEMTYLKDKYMAKVAELSEKNKELTSQNQNLSQEVTKGKQTIDKLTDKVISQQNKVDLASRLTATNIKVSGVYYRENFKKQKVEETATKSKYITHLKFCYTLGANIVADAGKRDIFVQVIDPHGQTIAIESLGSGTTNVEGTQSQFTTKEQIDYTKEPKEYCGTWTKGSAFEAGLYHVVISTEGYKLGEKEFKIK